MTRMYYEVITNGTVTRTSSYAMATATRDRIGGKIIAKFEPVEEKSNVNLEARAKRMAFFQRKAGVE